MKKAKVKFLIDAYGVIDGINDGTIYARIYDINTYEYIDDITLSIDEFCTEHQELLHPTVIFTWRLGYIGKKAFSNFRVKMREYPRLPKMTYEEICELSRRIRNNDLIDFGEAE